MRRHGYALAAAVLLATSGCAGLQVTVGGPDFPVELTASVKPGAKDVAGDEGEPSVSIGVRVNLPGLISATIRALQRLLEDDPPPAPPATLRARSPPGRRPRARAAWVC